MTELFPSILPDDDSYTASELQQWDWMDELRPIAARLDTDEVTGRSTQLEVVHYLSGRYSRTVLDEMRVEINTEEPDFTQIANRLETLDAYDNGS